MSERINYNSGEIINNGLIYVKDVEQKIKFRRRALFVCKCGTKFKCEIVKVKSGHTKSCGCLVPLSSRKYNTIHGDREPLHYLYSSWCNIKNRCFNKSFVRYKDWGGRGITMYSEWINDYPKFKEWILSNIGERPSKKYSIDRINNDGNYEPNNLRWADAKTQNKNRRTNG
jgi:hypothetical protein